MSIGANNPAAFARLAESLATKPHGTRGKYISGCRCMLCRAANSRYEVARDKARRNGDWNGIVDAVKEALRPVPGIYMPVKFGEPLISRLDDPEHRFRPVGEEV